MVAGHGGMWAFHIDRFKEEQPSERIRRGKLAHFRGVPGQCVADLVALRQCLGCRGGKGEQRGKKCGTRA